MWSPKMFASPRSYERFESGRNSWNGYDNSCIYKN